MPIYFNKIYFQRLLFGINAIALLIIAAVTFSIFISSPTDENVFRDVSARLMFVKTINGQLLSGKPFTGFRSDIKRHGIDSLRTGDLILKINGGEPKTTKDIYEMVSNGPKESRFEILRPSLNYVFEFKVDRSAINDDAFIKLPNYAYVTDVIPNGASDRAGMNAGDLIIRINEKEFKNSTEADQILRSGQIGKSLKYDVLRNNEIKTLQVILAKFGIQFSILIFCLSGFVVMIVGSFIVISRPNIFSAKLIGLGLLYLGFFMSVMLVRRIEILTPLVLTRNILMGAAYAIGIAFIFHSTHYFPTERPELISRRWIAISYYVVSIVTAVLVGITNGFLFLFIFFVYGAVIMFRFRKYASPEYKKLNVFTRWSAILTVILSACAIFFFRESTTGTAFGIVGILLTSIPLAYIYTIGRYRLLDLNLRVRRNTQYSILTAIWAAVIFVLLIWTFFSLPLLDLPKANIIFTGASIEINDSTSLSPQRISAEKIILMLLAIGSTFGFFAVRKSGQKIIDKKYFRQQYDYRKASHEIAEILATTLTMEELAKGFIQKLSALMKLKRAGVVFFRDENCCSCASSFGFNDAVWKTFCLTNEKLLIPAIKQFKNEFRVDYLPSPLKEEFQSEGFQYLVPISSKERLIGVLMIGEKLAETTLTQEDLLFLSSAAKQASVAIENAFLYEELAEKERMKHELQIARRIQLESLPQKIPQVAGLQISGTSVPAMEVGGDFYDYLTRDKNKLTIIIGDVSGKGTSAALYMSKVQGILRSLHGFDLSPKELFHRANTLLCQDLEKRSFVTVLGAEFHIQKNKVSVARAGHLPLFHYKATQQRIEKIIPRGLGLGLNDAGVFTSEMEQKEIHFETGDIFLFATDGVSEAHNDVTDFGEEKMQELLIAGKDNSPQEIQQSIIDSIKSFVGNQPQHDDQTVVVVKIV